MYVCEIALLKLIQVYVYYERFSGGFSGDQFYFYHGDGRFLGERGKVFNDFFQIEFVYNY